jgi:hypothetical protein
MSLVKSPELTPEKWPPIRPTTGNRKGRPRPRGRGASAPPTPYYSKAPGAEMHLLGEDKEE